MKKLPILFFLLPAIFAGAQDREGIRYFNQVKPGTTSRIFAPGIVSTQTESEFGSIYSKNGKEFYYAIQDKNGKAETRVMTLVKGAWSKQAALLRHDVYSYNDPFLSPDESRLYFISDQPLSGSGHKKDFDIWYIERNGDRWSKPFNAGPNINSIKNEYYSCITKNGTLYYSSNARASETGKDDYDVYAAKFENGNFQKAVRLDWPVNTPSYEGDVFVAPDESYLIVCSDRPGGFGAGDLYVCFKKSDGTWGEAKNLGKGVNEDRFQYCPIITHDGKYLLFTSKDDIRWVETKVIETLSR